MATSLIGEKVTVTGTLISSGDVSIDGRINGDIHATGTVLITENGKIFGNLYAESAIVRGRLEGSLNAKKVQLNASCHVKGDILQGRIAIEDGAFFDGQCRHADNPLANAPKA